MIKHYRKDDERRTAHQDKYRRQTVERSLYSNLCPNFFQFPIQPNFSVTSSRDNLGERNSNEGQKVGFTPILTKFVSVNNSH